jgi:hypothetical protein
MWNLGHQHLGRECRWIPIQCQRSTTNSTEHSSFHNLVARSLLSRSYYLPFGKPERSLQSPQESATAPGPSPDPDDSSPHLHVQYIYVHYNIILCSMPTPWKSSLSFRFSS